MLREQIEKCIELTVELVNAHHDLPKDKINPADLPEMCRDIHNIQNRLYAIANQNGIILTQLHESNKV